MGWEKQRSRFQFTLNEDRLPYDERMRELAWYHTHFNTPDDLAQWPAELDGGMTAMSSHDRGVGARADPVAE